MYGLVKVARLDTSDTLMDRLVKTAADTYDFKDDPKWKEKYQRVDEAEKHLYSLTPQLDEAAKRKEDISLAAGGLLGGGVGATVGGYQGSKLAIGKNPIARGLTGAVGGAGGMMVGGLAGALGGSVAAMPAVKHYQRQQDPALMKQINEARDAHFDAVDNLVDYEWSR